MGRSWTREATSRRSSSDQSAFGVGRRLLPLAGLVLGLAAALSLGLGCQNRDSAHAADLSAPSSASFEALSGIGFDGVRALDDLTRLEQLGDRHTGSRGAGKARSYIRRSLRRSGFDVRDVDTMISVVGEDGESSERHATHVFARREGVSPDVILLVAPYDTRESETPASRLEDAGDSASGASVLLELARVDRAVRKSTGEQPFTRVLAFVDGDGLGRRPPGASPAETFPGSDAFGRWWLEEMGEVDVRLVVWIDRVGEGQVEVARDLESNRVFRETFFNVGEERGLEPAFMVDRPLSAPPGGHRALKALGLRPVVALVGDTGARRSSTREAASLDGGTAYRATAPSAASLAGVGEATFWGLARISDRLARIDAFRLDPLGGGPESVALPGADERGEPPAATDAHRTPSQQTR